MERLTDADLQAIKERAERTEPGWVVVDGVYVVSVDDEGNDLVIAECNNENTAYFIGEARQDIPKLIAKIESLEERISRLTNCLTKANDLLDDVYEVFSDDEILHNHPTIEAVSEYFNVKGEREYD